MELVKLRELLRLHSSKPIAHHYGQ